MSTYTDLSLEPLQLEHEFDAETQEPNETQPTNDAPSAAAAILASPYDDLQLKSDPHLARFFDTIGE
jgi:predicted cobalt transporter CbtA